MTIRVKSERERELKKEERLDNCVKKWNWKDNTCVRY